jgi:hypothetical protein
MFSRKHRRHGLEHLDELAAVGPYGDDRQIEEARYAWRWSATPSYTVRLWCLDAKPQPRPARPLA